MYQSQIDQRAAELEAADKRMDAHGQIIDSGEIRACSMKFGTWCYAGQRYCKPEQRAVCERMLADVAGIEDVKNN